jgi:hypothetical protein
MLTKSLTSLALCALALTAAQPAGAAVPVGAAETSTTVVVTPSASSSSVTTKARHHRRRRPSLAKNKVVVKVTDRQVVDHHAEPARTPQVAALSTPLNLAKARDKKEVTSSTTVTTTKGEIMVGTKTDAKVVLAPSATVAKAPEMAPAEIEVKTPGARTSLKSAHTKVQVKVVEAPATVKVEEGRTSEAETTKSSEIALDVRSAESKTIAKGTGRAAAEGSLHAKIVVAKPACLHDGVEFVRGQEAQTFSLTRCDGSIAPLALEKLSILARPESAPLPRSVEALAKVKGPEIATGIRRVDPGLVARVQAIVDHFSKAGPVKVSVVSGYRPLSSGSYHATAQALDMHIEGARNEAVVEFCKTLADTGCGYYPNSSFIHVDVRQPGTGHVAWIDASGPGETPHYVSSWPPPPEPDVKVASKTENVVDKLDPELPPLPADEHPSAPRDSAAVIAVPLDTAK